MEYYQCPISLITEDTWSVIELILTQEETGIPIYGTDLINQTPAMFRFREVILSERAECQREISKLDSNRNANSNSSSNKQEAIPMVIPEAHIKKPGKGNPVRKFNVPVRPQKRNKKA